MGKILECGGNKAFQNLEQCHEIQGEFKKKPLYYVKVPHIIEDNNINNRKNNRNDILLNEKFFDKDSELNLIIYNNDEFGYDNTNYNINNNKKNLNLNNKKKFNKSWEYKKKEKNISLGNINNSANNKDNNNINNIIEKDIKNFELKNKAGIRLIYNNSENNIKNKTNDKRIIKKFINNSKINKSKENKKDEKHKILNNLFINKKYNQFNYIQNNNNLYKINETDRNKNKEKMKTTEPNESNEKKKLNNSIKRNKSHQVILNISNSENNLNSKFRKSLKEKKGNYIFRPKIKTKNPLYKNNNIINDYFGNESRRKTNLTSENTSPKLTNEKFFKRNENEIINHYKKHSSNNTHRNKYTINKFLLKNNSENFINALLNSKNRIGEDCIPSQNIFDSNINLINNRRHHSNNVTNKIKLINDEKKDSLFDINTNKDILKIKIPFKGTQINHNLLNSSVNDIFILNYNMLSKFSDKNILYDGNIYKVVNSKNDESKFVLRYFQITKKNFKYFNNIHSVLMSNETPLEEFDIKYIRDIEIIDIKLLIKNKTETKIKFAFVINMVENINFYIFATDDIDAGMNVINILNLLKKFYDKEKDLFK